jgi:hypothetical protein
MDSIAVQRTRVHQRIGVIVQVTFAFNSRPSIRSGIFFDPLIVDTVAGSGSPFKSKVTL